MTIAPWRTALATFAFFVVASRRAQACESVAPWSRLPSSAEHVLSPLPLSFVAGAAAAPLLLAPTGGDYELRLVAQRDFGGRPNAEPVSVWTPYVLAAVVTGVDIGALSSGACETARSASAMLQAMGASLVMVTSLKWITSRTWPSGGLSPQAPGYLQHPENARRFNWFAWNRGTAWPSGHTTIMFAAATALSTVEFGRSWVGYAAYAASAGVAAGMWLGDHHWASDIISGGLLGAAIGRSVGLAFREGTTTEAVSYWVVTPLLTGELRAIQVAVSW
jgi:membrane-associated phospholipid phosphatase